MIEGQGFKLDDGTLVDLETYLASDDHARDMAKNSETARTFCLLQGKCPWCGSALSLEAPEFCEEPENHEGRQVD